MDEMYKELCTNNYMSMHHMYGQISFNSCLSNAFKLKLGHNVNIFVVEMMRATGKEMAEYVIRPTKVIPLAM